MRIQQKLVVMISVNRKLHLIKINYGILTVPKEIFKLGTRF